MSEPTIIIPKAEFDRLIAEIAALKEEIRLLKNGRDSGTSSTPPSQDLGRSNAHSLREKSGKPAWSRCSVRSSTRYASGAKRLCRALDDTRRQTIPDGDMLNSYKDFNW